MSRTRLSLKHERCESCGRRSEELSETEGHCLDCEFRELNVEVERAEAVLATLDGVVERARQYLAPIDIVAAVVTAAKSEERGQEESIDAMHVRLHALMDRRIQRRKAEAGDA